MRIASFGVFALMLTTCAAYADDGDAKKGEKAFKVCKACHTVKKDGKNKVGPNLYDIVGKPAGSKKEFKYSKTFAAKAAEGLVWDEETLDTWLENPKKFIKKTKMVQKVKNEKKRKNIIAYLKTLKDDSESTEKKSSD